MKERKQGHSALRVKDGKIKTFDPHPAKRTQQQIDISNLRFYSAMAHDFKWQTDIIHYGVISQTLSEIADRLAERKGRSE